MRLRTHLRDGAAEGMIPPMRTSRKAFVAPLVSALVAVVACAAACSSSTGVTVPPTSSPPPGTTFVGGQFGGHCSGDVYVIAGTAGWAFCDDGVWAYTTTDPSTDGYTPYMPANDGGKSSSDGASNNDGQVSGGDGQGPGTDGQGGSDGGQGGGSDGGQGGGSDGGQGLGGDGGGQGF